MLLIYVIKSLFLADVDPLKASNQSSQLTTGTREITTNPPNNVPDGHVCQHQGVWVR